MMGFDDTFIKSWFDIGGRTIGYIDRNTFIREFFDKLDVFSTFYNLIKESAIDGFCTVALMEKTGVLKGIDKLYFDFDVDDFHNWQTMKHCVNLFKEEILKLGAEPYILKSGSKGYHIYAWLPPIFKEVGGTSRYLFSLQKNFYTNLQWEIIKRVDFTHCKECGSFDVRITNEDKDIRKFGECMSCGARVSRRRKGESKEDKIMRNKEVLNLIGPDRHCIRDVMRVARLPYTTNTTTGNLCKPISCCENKSLEFFKTYHLDEDFCVNIFKQTRKATPLISQKSGWASNINFKSRKLNSARPLRSCMLNIMEEEHPSHYARLALALELHYCRFSKKDIIEVFKKFDDFDYNKLEAQLDSIYEKIAEGLKPFRCDTMKANGLCDMSCID